MTKEESVRLLVIGFALPTLSAEGSKLQDFCFARKTIHQRELFGYSHRFIAIGGNLEQNEQVVGRWRWVGVGFQLLAQRM
ncbi:hypothetical protein DFH06DRAFT_1187672 [Mycena polygramma]|nr:hypothetical protein DFH06DRAFT_1187672 [Mycena polygramma]